MGETYDNATDYDMSPFALAVDLIAGDLNDVIKNVLVLHPQF